LSLPAFLMTATAIIQRSVILPAKPTAGDAGRVPQWDGTKFTLVDPPAGPAPDLSGLVSKAPAATQTIQPTINIVPFAIKGVAAQSADLQSWQNSAGTGLAKITSAGGGSFSSVQSFGASTFTGTGSVVPFTVKGGPSQSTNLQEFRDNGNVSLALITSAGFFSGPGFRDLAFTGPTLDLGPTSISIGARSATNIPVLVNAAASQSADLQRWVPASGSGTNIQADGSVLARAGTISGTPMIARGAAGQTGAIFAAQSSGASPLFYVDSAGQGISAVNMRAPDFGDYRVSGTMTNRMTRYNSSSDGVGQHPIVRDIWHDLLAFNKTATPTVETTADPTGAAGWAAVGSPLLTKPLFAHLEDQTLAVIDPASTAGGIYPGNAGIRWTWTSGNFQFCNGAWLTIGWGYRPEAQQHTILWETSTDGVTWTNRANVTGDTGVQEPRWYFTNNNGGDSWIRLTIVATNSNPVTLSSIRWMSYRWGSQGRGKELEKPYAWDKDRNFAVGPSALGVANVDANASLTILPGIIGLSNVAAAPSANRAGGGGFMYSEAGALKWRGSAGTITQLAPA
jgi:hypothetical protein